MCGPGASLIRQSDSLDLFVDRGIVPRINRKNSTKASNDSIASYQGRKAIGNRIISSHAHQGTSAHLELPLSSGSSTGASISTNTSREAAKECSPRRKAWVSYTKRTRPRRGERNYRRPTNNANSLHFHWQSTSLNPISRNHRNCVSKSNNLFDGSSVSTVNPIRDRNSSCNPAEGDETCSRLQNTPPGFSIPKISAYNARFRSWIR